MGDSCNVKHAVVSGKIHLSPVKTANINSPHVEHARLTKKSLLNSRADIAIFPCDKYSFHDSFRLS